MSKFTCEKDDDCDEDEDALEEGDEYGEGESGEERNAGLVGEQGTRHGRRKKAMVRIYRSLTNNVQTIFHVLYFYHP